MSKGRRSGGLKGLGRALGLFRSRRFVLGTMVTLTVIYFLGVTVPQQRRIGPAAFEAWREAQPRTVAVLEALGMTDAFRAPLTYFVLTLFFLSLIAVITQRLPGLWRRTRVDQGVGLNPRSLERRPGVRVLPRKDPDAAVARIGARLEAEGYRLHSEAGGLRGVRFRFAPLGFLFFHASFGLLLAGGVTLDQSRFSVTQPVSVGEVFSVKEGPFTEVPRLPRAGIEAIPDFAFQVLSITPEATEGYPTDLSAEVLVAGELQPTRFRVNEPLVRGSTSLLIMSVGPTALFVCRTREGTEDGVYVKLDPLGNQEARFWLKACGLEILARPFAKEQGGIRNTGAGLMVSSSNTGRIEPNLPEGIEVAARRSEGEEPVRGVLEAGRSVSAPDGSWTLKLEEVRYYGEFQIIDEEGGLFLVLAFCFALLGLCARLVLYRREVVVVPDGERVLLFATADGVGLDRRERLADTLSEID
ncbi:MAG: cytochrome c biogenesis protein ResB [Deltaproteobacteria bacterium]|nr:cytochrome c biogenesis protein ResB [Deltaproteobacteria bacterium]